MSVICDAAECLGIPTSTAVCPILDVTCYSGVLGVPDYRGFSRRFECSSSPNTAIPVSTPGSTNGPLNDDSSIKMNAPITNPWCVPARFTADFEFGAGIEISLTDHYSLNGDVNMISGAGAYFEMYPAPTYLVPAAPYTIQQATLDEHDGTAHSNSDVLDLIGWQGSYSLAGILPAGITMHIEQTCRFEFINVRGAGRIFKTVQVGMVVHVFPAFDL